MEITLNEKKYFLKIITFKIHSYLPFSDTLKNLFEPVYTSILFNKDVTFRDALTSYIDAKEPRQFRILYRRILKNALRLLKEGTLFDLIREFDSLCRETELEEDFQDQEKLQGSLGPWYPVSRIRFGDAGITRSIEGINLGFGNLLKVSDISRDGDILSNTLTFVPGGSLNRKIKSLEGELDIAFSIPALFKKYKIPLTKEDKAWVRN